MQSAFTTCSGTQSLCDLSVGAFNSHGHKHPAYPPLSALHTWIGGMLILRSYKVFLMIAHLYLFARYISLYVKNYYCFRYFTEQPFRWLYFIKLFFVFTCPFWHKKVPISANIETGINYYLLFSENWHLFVQSRQASIAIENSTGVNRFIANRRWPSGR